MQKKLYVWEWAMAGSSWMRDLGSSSESQGCREESLSLKFIACVPLTTQNQDMWALDLVLSLDSILSHLSLPLWILFASSSFSSRCLQHKDELKSPGFTVSTDTWSHLNTTLWWNFLLTQYWKKFMRYMIVKGQKNFKVFLVYLA